MAPAKPPGVQKRAWEGLLKGRLPLWLFSITVLWTLFWSGRNAIWGDSVLDLEAARGLLHEGSLSIGAQIRPDLHPGPAGRYFVKYSLLQTLPLVPAAAIFEACLSGRNGAPSWAFLAMTAPAALLAGWGVVGLWFFLRRLRVPPRTAALAALVAYLSTPWWVYGRCYFGENLQTGALCWLLWAWLRSRQQGESTLWLGLIAGLSLNCKLTFASWLLILAADQLRLGFRHKDLAGRLSGGLLGAAPGLFLFFGYNLYRYDTLWRTGYDYGRDADLGFATPLWVGLHGLLLSPGKSVFLYAPALCLLPSAWRYWAGRYREEVQLLTLMVLAQLAVVACWWAWSGDWAWGPRLILLVLPLLTGLVYATGQRMAAPLCALGLTINFLGVLVPAGSYIRQTLPMNQAMMQHPDRVQDDALLLHYAPDFSPIVGHSRIIARKLGLTGQAWQFRRIAEWNDLPITDPPLDLWWGSEPLSIALWIGLLTALAGGAYAWRRLD